MDPLKETTDRLDLIIHRGKIERILPAEKFDQEGPQLEVIDATGKLVLPGLIDMHVHLREPGDEHKETIATGAMAGVAGGFVAVACMPNTDPVNDCAAVTRFILNRAREVHLLRVFPVAAITKGRKGLILTDFEELRGAGAVAVSDDGSPVSHRELMQEAIEAADHHGLVIISHCEDLSISQSGVIHEGAVSAMLGLKGIPAACEEVMVEREISLSKSTGLPVHIAHVSTAGSVRLIRQAKENGIRVTAETAPHYFTLDHTAVLEYDTHAKMNPPLRTPEDVQAIREGLAEDVIDVIATDHAPHSPLEKDVELEKAAFGVIGLETALPLTLDLVRKGYLSLPRAVRKLSFTPSGILGLQGGLLREGGVADLALVDPDCEYVLQEKDIHSKSKNSPFLGKVLRGRNMLTLVGGKVVWKG